MVLNGKMYTLGDHILVVNQEDPNVPLVVRILRLWKCQQCSGLVGAVLIRPTFLPVDVLNSLPSSLAPNEVFAAPFLAIFRSTEVIAKCHVIYPAGPSQTDPSTLPSGDATPTPEAHFVCTKFYDVPRFRFYPFSHQMSFTLGLQAAIEERRHYRNEPKKIHCTYTSTCEKSFNNVETLLKHAGDHIVTLPEVLNVRRVPVSASRTFPPPVPSLPMSSYEARLSDYPLRMGSSAIKSDLSEVARWYETDGEGRILWFAGPPLVTTTPDPPMHSVEYLLYRRSA